MDKDVSNKFLGKFISVEMLVLLFAGGLAYGTLSSEVSNNVQNIKDDKAYKKELNKDVQSIWNAVSVMKNNQDHFAKSMLKYDNNQKEMLKKQQEILIILERLLKEK